MKRRSLIEFLIERVSSKILCFCDKELLQKKSLLHQSQSLSGYLCKPQFLGPSISNKQRIQRWITVGVKSIAAGLPGTAIDYESVLVSRAPWWRNGVGRQKKRERVREEEGGKNTDWLHQNHTESCHIMLNKQGLNGSCKLSMMRL